MSSVKNERENPFQALSNSSINKPLSGDSKKRRKRRSKKKENEQESVEKVTKNAVLIRAVLDKALQKIVDTVEEDVHDKSMGKVEEIFVKLTKDDKLSDSDATERWKKFADEYGQVVFDIAVRAVGKHVEEILNNAFVEEINKGRKKPLPETFKIELYLLDEYKPLIGAAINQVSQLLAQRSVRGFFDHLDVQMTQLQDQETEEANALEKESESQ